MAAVIQGDVGAVKAATDAGAETATAVGEVLRCTSSRDRTGARKAPARTRRPRGATDARSRHAGAATPYLPIPSLGRQFARTWERRRARGYPAIEGDHALIVEVAPALAIERITDLALRSVPEIEPGILYVERQFGVLDIDHADQELVDRAGAAILEGIGATPADALRPNIPLRRRDRADH